MASLIGQSLGRYHILEQLGEGGMATVYKAYDTRLERDVAVKIIRKTAFSAEILERVLARFEREAKALAKLSHPNIVKVHDYGDHEGSPYLVLEYLPGGTLKQLLGKFIPWQSAIQLILPIARGLAYAHQRGIIHRDVKPSNILITESGEPLLSDFGIAKLLENEEGQTLTGSGVGIGTPEYMAPEQGVGHGVDARVDIYSLGIVVYEMVTGRKPYMADTPMAVVLKQMTDPLPRPTDFNREIPLPIEKMLIKALAKKPQDRYESMNDFIAAMEACLAGKLPIEKNITRVTSNRRVDDEKTIDQISTVPSTIDKRKPAYGKIKWIAVVAITLLAIVITGILSWPSLTSLSQPSTLVPTLEIPTSTLKPEQAKSAFTEVIAPVEITLWVAYNEGSTEEIALSKALAEAAKDLPQYKVNTIQVPFSDIYTKYRTEVSAGEGPDMYIAPNDSLGDDVRAGLIADITDLTKGRLDGVAQIGIDGMSLNGKIYGVPESLKAVSFWYNTSLLSTPPATTDEMANLMKSGKPIGINYGCYHIYGFYSAFGGQIFDSNWKIIADQGNGVVDTFTYLNNLYKISTNNGWAKNDYDGLAPFSEAKLAAIINGNWAMADYRSALGDKLAVAPLPAGPLGPARPMLGVDGFYINPNSTHKEASLEVALYLTNANSQITMMNEAGHVPVRTDITITDPLIQGLVEAFNSGTTIRPQTPEIGNYWSNFCTDINTIFINGLSPIDWVRTATENANQ